MYMNYVNMLSDIDKVETENSEMVVDKYVPVLWVMIWLHNEQLQIFLILYKQLLWWQMVIWMPKKVLKWLSGMDN